MIRVPDSAKPMLDDLVRAAAAGQPLELSDGGAETLCRILLDMPDIGLWKKTCHASTAAFTADMAQLLLAVDVLRLPRGQTRSRRILVVRSVFDYPGECAINSVIIIVLGSRPPDGFSAPAAVPAPAPHCRRNGSGRDRGSCRTRAAHHV